MKFDKVFLHSTLALTFKLALVAFIHYTIQKQLINLKDQIELSIENISTPLLVCFHDNLSNIYGTKDLELIKHIIIFILKNFSFRRITAPKN